MESLPAEVFGVAEVRLHPNFRFTPQADRFDVAVVVLDRPAPYRENIRPICIPRKGADFLGRTAYAAGWGALEPGETYIYILKVLRLQYEKNLIFKHYIMFIVF